MILGDADIRASVATGQLTIDPFRSEQVQPASYDFRLSQYFLEIEDLEANVAFSFSQAPEMLRTFQHTAPRYVLLPGACVLALSEEYFAFDNRIAGQVRCKSSIARLFLTITSDACYFDPGFRGHAVIEIVNHNPFAVELVAGQRIGQMIFTRLEHPAVEPYTGNYENQMDFAIDRWIKALKKIGELR